MDFVIKHGLFKLNITDHHAILGMSIDAEPKQIRLRYLKIAQQLHPDKCRSDQAKKKQAGQILSKLVNPAYENLSRKTAFAEHQLVLVQVGKRLAENKEKITVKNPLAQELLKAKESPELIYPKLLKKLVVEQYQDLQTLNQIIGSISELNLIYLMLKGDRGVNRQINQVPAAKPKNKSAVKAQKASPAKTSSVPEEPTTESRVTAFVNRAQQYISKGEFDRAITELKDALRIDPNHGLAHGVMGKAYLHKKQITMAKVHIAKAYKAAPHNQVVMDTKKALDRMMGQNQKSKRSNPDSTGKSNGKNNKPAPSGFFSGFFGAKKK
ncbi:MAG: DnaJ domain-containing protein [Cyanobacteria bacterium J06621_8]